MHPKILEKEEQTEQTKPNTNRRKEITKINAKINKIKSKYIYTYGEREEINKIKSLFFEKINKIDKSSARLAKHKQIIKILKKRGAIIINFSEIKKILTGKKKVLPFTIASKIALFRNKFDQGSEKPAH